MTTFHSAKKTFNYFYLPFPGASRLLFLFFFETMEIEDQAYADLQHSFFLHV